MAHVCRCGSSWGGLRTAHCGACHETFTTVGNFDKHRRNGKCAAPTKVGLVADANGRWTAAGANDEWWQKASTTEAS